MICAMIKEMITCGFVFVLLYVLELLYFKIADRYNIVDKPNERSSHKAVTLRGGGIVFFFGALLFFIMSGCCAYPWMMAGLALITLVSFVDDIHSLPDKYRLIAQFLAVLLMFNDTTLYSLLWLVPIALIVCVGIINAYNFMDGINGITGGYSLVVLCGLLYVNEKVCSFVDTRLITTMIAADLVFCFFNFRKKAKCFAGDVGSVSMAFVIVFMLTRLMLKTNDIGWLCFLAVYGIDTVLTIVHRIMLHENLGQAHRKHMFQLMANELEIPHLTVSLLYMLVQGLIIAIYLLIPNLLTAVVSLGILGLIYVLFMRKYYKLHSTKN